jgi:hypothetical protein
LTSRTRFENLAAPPTFIFGQHRSGTTWVFDLLTHPAEVAGVFESWMFTPEFGFGSLLHWGHWDPDHVDKVTKKFERRPGLGQLVAHEVVVDQCRALAEEWLGNALAPGQRFLVEKSPDHLYATRIIDEFWPDARYVHVLRDGRDVLVSARAALSWDPWMPSHLSARDAAARWRRVVEQSRSLARELGPRFLEVRYEDLKADPVGWARKLFAFSSIPVDEDAIAAAIDSTDFGKHYTGGETDFRRAGRTGDWRGRLNLFDRLMFQRGSGSSLQDAGYERFKLWWLRPKRTIR